MKKNLEYDKPYYRGVEIYNELFTLSHEQEWHDLWP